MVSSGKYKPRIATESIHVHGTMPSKKDSYFSFNVKILNDELRKFGFKGRGKNRITGRIYGNRKDKEIYITSIKPFEHIGVGEAEELKGRGVGSHILSHIERKAQKNGVKSILAKVNEPQNFKFFEKNGFYPCSRGLLKPLDAEEAKKVAPESIKFYINNEPMERMYRERIDKAKTLEDVNAIIREAKEVHEIEAKEAAK